MMDIIYLTDKTGYKVINVKSKNSLNLKLDSLKKQGKHVVCVIDANTIIHKCDGFEAHNKFIRTCYPNASDYDFRHEDVQLRFSLN
jgi:hypothetical protein